MANIKIEKRTLWDVYLEGKHIGQIRINSAEGERTPQRYQYFPNGQKQGGEIFSSLEACKASLF